MHMDWFSFYKKCVTVILVELSIVLCFFLISVRLSVFVCMSLYLSFYDWIDVLNALTARRLERNIKEVLDQIGEDKQKLQKLLKGKRVLLAEELSTYAPLLLLLTEQCLTDTRRASLRRLL